MRTLFIPRQAGFALWILGFFESVSYPRVTVATDHIAYNEDGRHLQNIDVCRVVSGSSNFLEDVKNLVNCSCANHSLNCHSRGEYCVEEELVGGVSIVSNTECAGQVSLELVFAGNNWGRLDSAIKRSTEHTARVWSSDSKLLYRSLLLHDTRRDSNLCMLGSIQWRGMFRMRPVC
jgi:hypothetical protein